MCEKGECDIENNICRFSEVISGDLICSDFVYEKNAAQANETFTKKYILALVTGGSGVLSYGEGCYPITAGNAFFISQNSYFSVAETDSLAYFYISFYGRRADELAERFALSSKNCIFDLAEHCESLTAFLFDCINKVSNEKTDILSECALLYLIAHLDGKKRAANPLLNSIIEITNKNFTDPSFALAALSRELNYTAKYLSFFFKRNKGVCFNEYLRSLRIKHSVFLMEQGITSIKNIALLSGFSDSLYYSKIFKKEIGASPKEYIDSLSKNQ